MVSHGFSIFMFNEGVKTVYDHKYRHDASLKCDFEFELTVLYYRQNISWP